jgi:hypothetical protein
MHEYDPLRHKWLDYFDALIAEAEDLGQKGHLVQGRPRVTALYTGEVLSRDSDYVTVDAVKFEAWKEKCIALLNQIIPKDNPSYKLVKDLQRKYYPSSSLSLLQTLAARLSAVCESFRAGLFDNFSATVSAESAVDHMAEAKTPSQEQSGSVNLPPQTDAGAPKSSARRKTPSGTEAAVLLKSKRRCCLCYGLSGDHSQKPGQLAHIDRDPSNSDESNLVFLCLKHHDQYDTKTSQSKGLTPDELRHHRDALYAALGKGWKIHRSDQPDGSVGTSEGIDGSVVAKRKFKLMQHRLKPQPTQGVTTSVTVNDTVNSGIIAGNLTIKGAPRPKLMPAAGSIATDLARRNYILHLINRYIEFKSADKTQGKFKPIIYGTIKREFGATWDAVPLDRFDDLAAYLKSRIDKTIVGKRNARLNYKNYSGFEDPRWQGRGKE